MQKENCIVFYYQIHTSNTCLIAFILQNIFLFFISSENKEADIPMQRMACRKFAAEHGWEIVFEDQEDGISGHKIRAENRDKIQLIKQRAKKKQFDILLVF